MKQLKVNTGDLKKYISNSPNYNNKYKFLLPDGSTKNSNELDQTITDWSSVKLERKRGADYEPLGFDIELYNNHELIPISENKEIMELIRSVISEKIPSLRSHVSLKLKLKEFKTIYDNKVDDLEESLIMQIMNSIKTMRETDQFEFNDILFKDLLILEFERFDIF